MAIGPPNRVFGRVASNPSVPEKAAQGEGSRPGVMIRYEQNFRGRDCDREDQSENWTDRGAKRVFEKS